jgi:hypothetical protein
VNRIMNWWYRRQRRIDIEILWPACCRNAPTTDQARAAFAMHAFNDDAWLVLGFDAVYAEIDKLEVVP